MNLTFEKHLPKYLYRGGHVFCPNPKRYFGRCFSTGTIHCYIKKSFSLYRTKSCAHHSLWNLLVKKSRTISRVMSWMIICLLLLLPAASSDPPENNPGQIIVLHSVLLRVRFTWHSLLPENRWALTPPFHPYWHKPAVYLCCTIFGVTSTGRYPAPCPVKPGLSSSQTFR